ncbi:hypothetical protein BDQ12DRAFT_671616 [Crucibulum laeve]|uniref:Protein kinase domain-containing protein n=1 Tax=Crucibulum laeve TaxID=68775 RepID=A0A5C3LF43_9AGAR|nr:hypothetical protein BDQ12DRAFT_671616 [Crucibulum laeve]
MYALNEAFSYDKLRPAQGTVVPWFYGMHQFTLPDGTVLYGLLMEYIEGWALDSNFAQELSPKQLTKRNLLQIQSCHHAARILDVADVSQRDWHNGQILLCTNETTKADHVVLIDFASTTQTWDSDEPNLIENYFGILRVLLTDVGFDLDLVWKHYGEPDDWDTTSYYYTHPGTKEERHFRARDIFPYISCA